MKCNRRLALLAEIIDDWDKLNLAAKALVYIGLILFFGTIFLALNNDKSTELYKSIEVIFSSSLASVFGFILSSNIKTSNKDKFNIKTYSIDSEKSIQESCKDIIKTRYNHEGNSIQIMVAFFVTIISCIVVLSIYIFDLTDDAAVLSQFRDFMCMSIGFLLGESKIKKDK